MKKSKSKIALPAWILSIIGVGYLLFKGNGLLQLGEKLETKIRFSGWPQINAGKIRFPLSITLINPTVESIVLDELQVVIHSVNNTASNKPSYTEVARSQPVYDIAINPEKNTVFDLAVEGSANNIVNQLSKVWDLLRNNGTGLTYKIDTAITIAGNTLIKTEFKRL